MLESISRITLIISLVVGLDISILDAMDFAPQDKYYGSIQTDDRVKSSESAGFLSFIWSCFSSPEDNEVFSETSKLTDVLIDDSFDIPAAEETIHLKKMSHEELILMPKKTIQVKDELIGRLYRKLIPPHLVRLIDFDTLLADKIATQSGIPIPASKLHYKVITILITYLLPDKWPMDLVSFIQSRSDAGNAEAKYLLGYLYFNGKYFSKEAKTAYTLFKEAADCENANAQNYLGYLYSKGIGVEEDFYWAGYYYGKAADQGHVEALHNLGCLYERGDGVAQDFAKAQELFEKSSEQGNENAELSLLHLYETGKLQGKKNDDIAKSYIFLADQGNEKAQYHLGVLCKTGGDPKGFNVLKDLKLSLNYFKKAADQGHLKAQLEAADLCVTIKDERGSADYLWLAANQGNHVAQRKLGICYKNGDGVAQNFQAARECFLKSAEQGNSIAEHQLGLLYKEGLGVEKNLEVARDWFRKSKENGNSQGQYELALLYRDGLGVDMDTAKAGEWIAASALKENSEAQYTLGVMYSQEYCVTGAYVLHHKITVAIARQYIKLAADKENLDALYTLATDVGHSSNECYHKAARQGHELSLGKLEEKKDPKYLELRMETAHDAHLSSRQFFQKLCVDPSQLSPEESQKSWEQIDLFIQKIDNLDATYIAIGAMAAEEGNSSCCNLTGDSFKDSFPFISNSELTKMTLNVSNSLGAIREKLRRLYEVGTMITCLNQNEKFKVKEKIINNNHYLCLNSQEISSADFDPYYSEILKMLNFHWRIRDVINVMMLVDPGVETIMKVLRPYNNKENRELFDYMNLYIKYLSKDDQPKRQKLFISELSKYFSEFSEKLCNNFLDITKIQKELDALIVTTTPYRNGIFLKYIGL